MWLVKQFVNELSPFITLLFNASLCDGIFPPSLKCAVVTPALKKPTLDPSDTNNYRPISNLTFISKLLECIVLNQLNVCLQQFNLLPGLQSAYIHCHSTETAMLKVLSNAFVAADTGQAKLLDVLDLTAAYDTVDHAILIERLRLTFIVVDSALHWMTSYLTGRMQYVCYYGEVSTTTRVYCSVPQGLVLGPVQCKLSYR